MNEQMNVLLELLEEIKQQNREIKASLTSQPQPTQGEANSTNKEELNAIVQVLDAVLQGDNGFKEELIGALAKLGQRIREMKEGAGRSPRYARRADTSDADRADTSRGEAVEVLPLRR